MIDRRMVERDNYIYRHNHQGNKGLRFSTPSFFELFDQV